MYKGYRKIKKLSTEFCQGIKNSPRVSKMLIGYKRLADLQTCRLADLQTCMYSGNYFELCVLRQVSKMLGGYRKYQEGIKNV